MLLFLFQIVCIHYVCPMISFQLCWISLLFHLCCIFPFNRLMILVFLCCFVLSGVHLCSFWFLTSPEFYQRTFIFSKNLANWEISHTLLCVCKQFINVIGHHLLSWRQTETQTRMDLVTFYLNLRLNFRGFLL